MCEKPLAAWPALLAELGDPMPAESREQHLRHVLSILEELAAGGAIRDRARAIPALDILCLLSIREVSSLRSK